MHLFQSLYDNQQLAICSMENIIEYFEIAVSEKILFCYHF